MKKTTLILAALLLTWNCFAQADSGGMKQTPQQNIDKMKGKDYVMMKYDKMIWMKDGTSAPMEKTMTMSNGTKVMTDGTVIKKDGTKIRLNEGDCVYMDGKIVSMDNKLKDDKSNMEYK